MHVLLQHDARTEANDLLVQSMTHINKLTEIINTNMKVKLVEEQQSARDVVIMTTQLSDQLRVLMVGVLTRTRKKFHLDVCVALFP